jgi:hypothetical protein
VISNQPSQPLIAEGAKMAGAVKCMKAGLDERGSIAKVMEVRRHNQDFALLGWKNGRDLLRLADDALNVCPTVAQRRQQLLGITRRPLRHRHEPTIPGQPVAVVAWDELQAALVVGASFSHHCDDLGVVVAARA